MNPRYFYFYFIFLLLLVFNSFFFFLSYVVNVVIYIYLFFLKKKLNLLFHVIDYLWIVNLKKKKKSMNQQKRIYMECLVRVLNCWRGELLKMKYDRVAELGLICFFFVFGAYCNKFL